MPGGIPGHAPLASFRPDFAGRWRDGRTAFCECQIYRSLFSVDHRLVTCHYWFGRRPSATFSSPFATWARALPGARHFRWRRPTRPARDLRKRRAPAAFCATVPFPKCRQPSPCAPGGARDDDEAADALTRHAAEKAGSLPNLGRMIVGRRGHLRAAGIRSPNRYPSQAVMTAPGPPRQQWGWHGSPPTGRCNTWSGGYSARSQRPGPDRVVLRLSSAMHATPR